MITVKNIKKSFDGKEVLKGISAEFKQGVTNLIIGSSGTGKSVLLKCTVGLIKPDEGSVFFDGKNLYESDREEQRAIREQLGMLFQGSALFDSMTVEQNVRFPLDMRSRDMSDADKLERVNFCLKRVGLEGSNDKKPAEISGGMMKRVGIARAIVMNPKYLFCDEPNSGLDPQTSIMIDNLILEITEEYNMTTIVVTHDMNSVMEIGKNIVFLSKGHKEWEGTKEQIVHSDVESLNDFVFSNSLMVAYKKNEEEKRANG